MYRFIFIGLIFSLLSELSFTQNKQWVYFMDKGPEVSTLIQHPEAYLSKKAIERRSEMGIKLDEKDIPVFAYYLDQLKKEGIKVTGVSKWLNAASVIIEDKKELEKFAWVRDVQPVKKMNMLRDNTSYTPAPSQLSKTTGLDYGQAQTQNLMIEMDYLHDNGFTGEGMIIAVFDAGFYNMDQYGQFDSLFMNNKILATRDFVDGGPDVYDDDSHGMSVVSTIGANSPSSIIGSAPHASFILGRTEQVSSETTQEEDNWVMAMEWADSMGAHIIHSSLGYSVFDEDSMSYTYADMDGNTTIITRAADLAASRGILVNNSAGNEGFNSWHYITAPCDGDSVLCVGAVDASESHAIFSSWGPSSDGQVKPDVMAMGMGTAVVRTNGNVGTSQGTSFSGPIIAGLAACLWQAHPDRTNMEVIQAIIESADRFQTPDDQYGYGIPKCSKADSILSILDTVISVNETQEIVNQRINLFPNPVQDNINLELKATTISLKSLKVFTLNGKLVYEKRSIGKNKKELSIKTSKFDSGFYFVRVRMNDGTEAVKKFFKN